MAMFNGKDKIKNHISAPPDTGSNGWATPIPGVPHKSEVAKMKKAKLGGWLIAALMFGALSAGSAIWEHLQSGEYEESSSSYVVAQTALLQAYQQEQRWGGRDGWGKESWNRWQATMENWLATQRSSDANVLQEVKDFYPTWVNAGRAEQEGRGIFQEAVANQKALFEALNPSTPWSTLLKQGQGEPNEMRFAEETAKKLSAWQAQMGSDAAPIILSESFLNEYNQVGSWISSNSNSATMGAFWNQSRQVWIAAQPHAKALFDKRAALADLNKARLVWNEGLQKTSDVLSSLPPQKPASSSLSRWLVFGFGFVSLLLAIIAAWKSLRQANQVAIWATAQDERSHQVGQAALGDLGFWMRGEWGKQIRAPGAGVWSNFVDLLNQLGQSIAQKQQSLLEVWRGLGRTISGGRALSNVIHAKTEDVSVFTQQQENAWLMALDSVQKQGRWAEEGLHASNELLKNEGMSPQALKIGDAGLTRLRTRLEEGAQRGQGVRTTVDNLRASGKNIQETIEAIEVVSMQAALSAGRANDAGSRAFMGISEVLKKHVELMKGEASRLQSLTYAADQDWDILIGMLQESITATDDLARSWDVTQVAWEEVLRQQAENANLWQLTLDEAKAMSAMIGQHQAQITKRKDECVELSKKVDEMDALLRQIQEQWEDGSPHISKGGAV